MYLSNTDPEHVLLWRAAFKHWVLNQAGKLGVKVQAAGDYVTDRRSVTFFPQAGTQYSPNGTNVIEYLGNGPPWVDASSAKACYTIAHKTSKPGSTGEYANEPDTNTNMLRA